MNTPEFFAQEEEAHFISYLKNESKYYYLFEQRGKILGCGGFNFLKNENNARISWDMIDPQFQGKGIGRALVEYRISEIKKIDTKIDIQVRTSQLVFSFYEKQGFQLEEIIKDFWAPGYDLYRMKYGR